jgi:hypothetical protein
MQKRSDVTLLPRRTKATLWCSAQDAFLRAPKFAQIAAKNRRFEEHASGRCSAAQMALES